MRVVYKRCTGLDVHKKTVVACRRWTKEGGEVETEVKTFGTTTPELLELVDWLSEWEVTQVAMESTGEYWKPVFNLLEGNFEVLLVNAQHVKHVPGRKTDVKDAEWLAELLSYGLLKASFIPAKPQRDLRDLTRYRVKLVQERTRVVNRVQKVLENANIKLASVASDPLGVSGRQMLAALVAGETDATLMADLAKGRMRNKIPELEKALTGIVNDHHRFMLAQQLAHIDFLDEQIAEIEAEIGRRVEAMSEEPQSDNQSVPTSGSDEQKGGEAEMQLTWNEAVTLLDTIPGINNRTAEAILAETGIDMGQFPSPGHLARWAGVAPGNNQSGGKRYSGKTPPGNRALRTTLVQAAWAAQRTKGTYLSTVYRRLAGRRGKKRAIVAVAHSMLVSIYYMLLRHQPYQELGGDYFDQRRKEAKADYFMRQLQKLGLSVQVEPFPMQMDAG
jgi:transposase